MRHLAIRVGLCLLVVFVTTMPVWGQAAGTASLTGTVADPTGAVLPGAELTVTHEATGATRTGSTDASGRYFITQLGPGRYRIEVRMTGFRTHILEHVELLVATASKVDVTMEIGAVAEEVVVEGTTRGLNTADASLGAAISGIEVEDLPSLDRNPVGLLSLQPGVTYVPSRSDTAGGYGGVSDDDYRGGSVSGARSDQTNVTLDGIDVNDPIQGYAFFSALRVTQDSLQEFRVSTSNYPSEGGGRSSAAQVSLVTKSGTNELHGSAYYLHRNEALNANDWFIKSRDPDAEKGKFRRHLYGASLGGPVVKNRFFLFGNWERMEESIFDSATRNVPAMHLRDGVIIYACADPVGPDGILGTADDDPNPLCPAAPTQVQGISGTMYDVPAGFYGLDRDEITDIDGLGLGPNTAAMAQWQVYPEPNDPGSFDNLNILAHRFLAPVSNTFNAYIARADFNIDRGGKHTVFWRGSLQHDTVNTPPGLPGQDSLRQVRDAAKGFATGYTAVFSPTLVNTFRWGLTRLKDERAGRLTDEFVWHRFLFDPFGNTLTNGGTLNSSNGRTVPQHHFRDDFTWTRGKHTFTFGGEARYTRNRRFSDALSYHNFTVNPSWLPNNGRETVPGHSDCIAAGCAAVPISAQARMHEVMTVLLGPISQVDANYNFDRTGATLPTGEAVPRRYAVDEYEFYAQDTWRVTPTLTLNLGLRYFSASPPWEQNGNQVIPNPGMTEWSNCRYEAMLAGLPSQQACGLVEMVLAGKANNAPSFFKWDKNNFSPRVGVAWAPRSLGWFSGDGKMTIRLGYSLVYDRIGNALAVTFDQGGAFGMSTQISDSLGSCSIATEGNPPRPPCARFTGINDTAAAGAVLDRFGNPLLAASPGGGFPAVPPDATIAVAATIDDGLRTPYSHAATVSIARELPGDLIVEAAWVGRRGIKLPIQRDYAYGADLNFAGTTAIQAARDLIAYYETNSGLADGGLNALQPIAFWETLFPGFGPTGVNGGCLGWDPFGLDPLNDPDGIPDSGDEFYNCGYSSTQVAYDQVLGWHGTLLADGTADPGFGAVSIWLDAIDYGWPSYASFPGCTGDNQAGGIDTDADGVLDTFTSDPACPFTFFPGQWVALLGWTGLARSEYSALQFSVRKRMSHGLLFNVNYTLSHSLDHSSVPERDPIGGNAVGGWTNGWMDNGWDISLQYGDSDFDMRHQVNAHWTYELPIGRGRPWGSDIPGWANQIIGGWSISGIFRAFSGLPINVGNGRTWPTNWNWSPRGTCAPVGSSPLGTAVGPCPATQNTANGPRGPNIWADPDEAFRHFRHTLPGDVGNRNVMRGDNYMNLDFGIAKDFNMPLEGHRLQFRWDIFNLTNSAFFDSGTVNTSLTDPDTFGDYTATMGRERLMQVTLRYVF